ncbi:hypothetical protein OEZ85_010701 [Tetradesmus obliquus]|uniref:CBS domain-containing protein n=1 Tax=Tetradesmus obliquus TaxID=3088 RepID=A0ABY8TND0_TETOB|nr:hypothetical protein OEZ85_010701 [Tetradesmus obliquus]
MEPAAKRANTGNKTPSPLSLYRQAVKLVKQQQPLCADVSADSLIEQKLQQSIQALGNSLKDSDTAAHSLDLELCLDEPAFLLASTHLQLGLLYRRQDRLQEAVQQLQHSLKYFPRFVAAHSALGQVLKASAASQDELQQAEAHLQRAIAAAEQLAGQQDGLLLESNKACAAEAEAADAARSALAMLLCQSGREAQAAVHLAALGFKFRLSSEVLQYALPSSTPTAAAEQSSQGGASDFLLQVLDAALPQQLLLHLQQVFAPAAPFWREHSYGRVGYFSYFFRLDEPQSSSMHQLAHHLRQLALEYCPAAAGAQYAEFWAHCRRHSSGHQLHYDSDDEGQGGVRNPIFTSVLYLARNTASASSTSSSINKDAPDAPDAAALNSIPAWQQQAQQPFVGGPTLVTDQLLGGPLATKGWLAYSATNRFVMFDGKYLHGVIPGRGPAPAADGRRTTLMMAFWKELKCRTPPGTGVGACMHMPPVGADSSSSLEWPKALAARADGWGSCHPVAVQISNSNRSIVAVQGVQRSAVRKLATVPRPEELKQAQYTQSLLVARATSAGYASFDYEELLPADVDNCPHGYVEGLMLSADAVLTAKTTERLEDLIPKLNKASGLPVVDVNNRVIGVISRKDIIRVRRAEGSLRDLVEEHMTSPAVTVGPKVSVRNAAKIMLKQKIRRLPVVDGNGKALGLLSRSDIFKPLFKEDYEEFLEKERDAMATGTGVAATWAVKYLYDGDCAMCRSLKAVLERQDKRSGRISFIDISDPYYDPLANMGIEYDEAMETIHAIQPDGRVLQGTDALRLLFGTVGLGWAVDLMEIPLLNKLVDMLYEFLSANRISLGNALDGIIAAKRVNMSKQGVETCGDVDEECTIEW